MMFDVAESISITSGVSGSAPAPQAPVLGGEGFGVHGVELAGVARGFVEFVGQKSHCLGDSGLVRWIDCHGDGIGAEVDESCLVQQVAGDGSWDSRARFHRK